MASPGPPSIPPMIAQLTGPLFLGHLFNWGLFGALTVQVYLYYIAFPKDKLLPKAIVASTYFLELLQVVLSTRDAFRNFGTGWGSMAELDEVGWLWFSVPVLGSIIYCMAQLFYAWRIWILGRQPVIVAAIVVVAVVQLGFGVYAGAAAHIIGDFSKLQTRTFQTTAVWLGAAAVDDIIIAICMIFYLQRSNTGFRSTHTILTKFIRLTLETGLVCATFAILDLSFYCAFQSNNYHLAPSIPLSKLYTNSLLVVINARIRVVGGRENPNGGPNGSGSISYIDATLETTNDLRTTKASKSTRGTVSRPPGIAVSVAHETHAYADHELHIPMGDLKDLKDLNDTKRYEDSSRYESTLHYEAQEFDGVPLDVSPHEMDAINKNAHLV